MIRSVVPAALPAKMKATKGCDFCKSTGVKLTFKREPGLWLCARCKGAIEKAVPA